MKLDFSINFEVLLHLGFTLKTVLGSHDPRISWLLFETKNHEMWGPPVYINFGYIYQSIFNAWSFDSNT